MFGLVRTWFDICEKKIDLILSAIVTQMLTNNSFEFANGSFYILSKWINASVRIKLQKVTKNSINFPDIVEWKHYPGDNNWIIDCIHCVCFFHFCMFHFTMWNQTSARIKHGNFINSTASMKIDTNQPNDNLSSIYLLHCCAICIECK